jgi:hypothetical protein
MIHDYYLHYLHFDSLLPAAAVSNLFRRRDLGLSRRP